MGAILGKGYEEPPFEVILSRATNVPLPYEVRRYGRRYAVEAEYGVGGASPFQLLAGYIGVWSQPQNEEKKALAMTVPVAMHGEGGGGPSSRTSRRKMQFLLPNEYTNRSEDIPVPVNANVKVTELPPTVGAVHRYRGGMNRNHSKLVASKLVEQLKQDLHHFNATGDDGILLLSSYEYWRFHPPMTPPFWSRNEVWIELTEDQVAALQKEFF